MIVTSNREPAEWLAMLADPLRAQTAVAVPEHPGLGHLPAQARPFTLTWTSSPPSDPGQCHLCGGAGTR